MKTKKSWKTASLIVVLLLLSATALAGCGTKSNEANGEAEGGTNESGGGTEKEELLKVTQVTNWFAQPEHGGNYAALEKGYYKDAGLDMTIQSGGPGVSATQLVASGKAEFGMGSSDEVLLAREQGLPLVAIFGTFQKSPQALLYHADQPIEGMEDLNGRKVYVGSGSPFWEYFKKAYKLDDVTQVKYTGDLSLFLNDKTAVTQSYITSEPYVVKQKGVETKYLLNADFDFSPYGNLIYTTESFLKENPEAVKAFVEATAKGWEDFKTNWRDVIPVLSKANPDNPVDVMDYGAEALQPLVYEGDAAEHGVGYMSTERWEEMNKTLLDLGLLQASQDVSKAFTTEFLPKK